MQATSFLQRKAAAYDTVVCDAATASGNPALVVAGRRCVLYVREEPQFGGDAARV
jgi:hypothetical protein